MKTPAVKAGTKVTRAVYIPKELDEKIKELARRKERSVSFITAKLLEAAVENIEQYPISIDSRPVKEGGRK